MCLPARSSWCWKERKSISQPSWQTRFIPQNFFNQLCTTTEFSQLFIFWPCYITSNGAMTYHRALFFSTNKRRTKRGIKYLWNDRLSSRCVRQLHFSLICLTDIWQYRLNSILINTAVFTGHIMASISLYMHFQRQTTVTSLGNKLSWNAAAQNATSTFNWWHLGKNN